MTLSHRVRLQAEQLEDRCVPALFTVTNLNDGIGVPGLTLREAVDKANLTAATDTIVFKDTLKGTILLTGGDLDITKSLVISGPGSSRITINGNGARILNVDDLTAGLINVTIKKLSLTGGRASTSEDGGAIQSRENLTLVKMNIHNNQTTDGNGGGVNVSAGGGSLTLTKCTFNGNVADDAGGTAFGGAVAFFGTTLTVSSCSIFDNVSDGGGGLNIGTSSSATISNSTLSENRGNSGGGIRTSGTTTIRKSTISGNSTMIGNGDGGGIVHSTGALTVDACLIAGNSSGGDGGGISVSSGTGLLINSTIAANTANGIGGGIHMSGTGNVTLRNSTVSGNTAILDGGGIAVITGTLLVQNSTVAFNTTRGNGGGISTNVALSMESTIVARNRAFTNADDLFSAGAGDIFTITNCLIGSDPTGDALVTEVGTNFLNEDPLLGPLAFNGGPTPTHKLLAGSPAINTGSNPAGLLTDQRGGLFQRVKGGVADIGAFEL